MSLNIINIYTPEALILMPIYVLYEVLNESLLLPYDDSLENISIPENHSTKTSIEILNKKIQGELYPPERTRSIRLMSD